MKANLFKAGIDITAILNRIKVLEAEKEQVQEEVMAV